MNKAKLVGLILSASVLFTAASVSAQQAPPPLPPYGAPITFDQAKKAMAGAEALLK
jgi:hypothetical protein